MDDTSDLVNLVGPDGNVVPAARSQLSPDFIQQYAQQAAQQPPMQQPPAQAPSSPDMWAQLQNTLAHPVGAYAGLVPGASGLVNAAAPGSADAQVANSLSPGNMVAQGARQNIAAGNERVKQDEADIAKRKAAELAANQKLLEDQAKAAQQQPPPQQPGMPSMPPLSFKPYGGNQGAINKAAQDQENAIRAYYEAGAQRAAEQTGYQQKALEGQAKMEAQRQQMAGDYQRHRQEGMDKLQRMQDEFANTQIDPMRYWSNKSGFEKAMAAIAMGLGGFAGSSQPAQIIQQAVQDDIDAQKSNLSIKGKSIENQKGILGLMRQNFGDDIEANAAAKAALTTQLEARIKMLTSKYDSPQLKAQGDKLAAEVAQQTAMHTQDFMQRRDENAMKTSIDLQRLAMEKTRFEDERNKKAGPKQLDEKQVERIAELNDADQALNEMEKKFKGLTLASKAGSYVPVVGGSTDAASLDRDIQPFLVKYAKGLHGGSRVTPELIQSMAPTMPSSTGWSPTNQRKFNELRDKLARERETLRQSLIQGGFQTGSLQAPSVVTPKE